MGKNSKVWVTLLPAAKRCDLTKDVGMIPYLMFKNHGYDARLVCYKNDHDSSGLQDVKGLKLQILRKRFNPVLDGALYLLINGRNIDVLNLYHIGMKRLLLWLAVFRLVNRRGIVYLKLDMDYPGIEKLEAESNLKKIIRKCIFQKMDLITAESREICNRMNKIYDIDVGYIPDGFYFWTKSKERKKEKILLTVGRLGTRQKATEILLQSFANTASSHIYQLNLIGTIEKQFIRYVRDFFKSYPELKDRVIFKGAILNKSKLQEEFEKASIFLLPSRWESFGIVLAEAASCGDFLIVSDAVPSKNDFIVGQEFGEICEAENVQDLADKILTAIHIVEDQPDIHLTIREYAKENFAWEKIVCRLNIALKALEKGENSVA